VHSPEEERRTAKTFSQCSSCFGRDSNAILFRDIFNIITIIESLSVPVTVRLWLFKTIFAYQSPNYTAQPRKRRLLFLHRENLKLGNLYYFFGGTEENR